MKDAERSVGIGLALLFAFGLMLVRPPLARAAVNAFLKIADIKGESTDSHHSDEIDVLSWSWGVTRSGAAAATGAGSERATPGDITITKYVDRATPKFAEFRAKARVIPSMTLDTPSTEGVGGRAIYTLKNVTIVSTTPNPGGKTETVKFAYQSYSVVNTPRHK